MEYDRCDSFRFDFEPNRIPCGSKSKGKLSRRPYSIQCKRKWNSSFLSVGAPTHPRQYGGVQDGTPLPPGTAPQRSWKQRNQMSEKIIYNFIHSYTCMDMQYILKRICWSQDS